MSFTLVVQFPMYFSDANHGIFLISEKSVLSPMGNCRQEVKTSLFLDAVHRLSFYTNFAIELTYSLSTVPFTAIINASDSSRALLHRVDNPALRLQRTPPLEPQAGGGATSIVSCTNCVWVRSDPT